MIRTEWPWTVDPQTRPALAACDRCDNEIYNEREAEPDGHGHVYCVQCRAELEDGRAETALAVLEAVDAELKKYLSEEVCAVIWNRLTTRFKV